MCRLKGSANERREEEAAFRPCLCQHETTVEFELITTGRRFLSSSREDSLSY